VIEASPFDIHTELMPELARVQVSGELDLASTARLQAAVQDALGQGMGRLEIDLRGLSFVDSSGLRSLILLDAQAREQSWTLTLVRPSGAALAVFEMTGTEENLPFVEKPAQR
jgi:anti-sigma B factor antagonist